MSLFSITKLLFSPGKPLTTYPGVPQAQMSGSVKRFGRKNFFIFCEIFA